MLNPRNFGSILLSVLTFASFSLPSFGSPQIELVQSVPIETTLAVPGLRQTQQVWLEMIVGANKTIDLEQFYISNQTGQALAPVLNAIRSAAARGVQIRLLIDSQFFKNYPNDANGLSQVQNIEVRTIDYSSLAGGIQHSKYFVVDQSDSFVGSANFDWLALSHIHEVGLRVLDAQMALGLESVFSKDWEKGTALVKKTNSGTHSASSIQKPTQGQPGELKLIASPATMNPSGISDSLTEIISLLVSSKTSVKIQVYQYTTKIYNSQTEWQNLDIAIRNAASHGVHVQLLVDAVSLKSGGADLNALARLKNIEVRTVTIPEWSGGAIPYARLVHSKYFTIDNSSAWVGTENWSGDYFTKSRNVGFIVQTPKIIGQLNQVFDQVWNSAYSKAI